MTRENLWDSSAINKRTQPRMAPTNLRSSLTAHQLPATLPTPLCPRMDYSLLTTNY